MLSRTIICFSLVLALIFPTVVLAASADSMATLEEIMAFLGYSEADGKKLLGGEIISRGRESGTEKELAVTVAMLVRAPLAEVNKFIAEGKLYAVNKDIIDLRDLGDAPVDKDSFAKLGFGGDDEGEDEIEELFEVEPGSDFNLSTAEIERFQSVAKGFKSKDPEKDPAVRAALNAEYRAILMERFKAYRQGGLGVVAPYDRGDGEQAKPGEELTGKLVRETLMKEKMPEFYRAVLNYPRYGTSDIQNQFMWINQRSEDRPTFILAHRMHLFKPEEYVITVFREFYVGHSYNSLHESAAALAVKQGTIVLYGNRTSTDQVTGFGGGLKRNVGRGMMRDDLVKLFKAYRISAEQGGKK